QAVLADGQNEVLLAPPRDLAFLAGAAVLGEFALEAWPKRIGQRRAEHAAIAQESCFSAEGKTAEIEGAAEQQSGHLLSARADRHRGVLIELALVFEQRLAFGIVVQARRRSGRVLAEIDGGHSAAFPVGDGEEVITHEAMDLAELSFDGAADFAGAAPR